MEDLTHTECLASGFLTGAFILQKNVSSSPYWPPLPVTQQECAGVVEVLCRVRADSVLIPGLKNSLSKGVLNKKPRQQVRRLKF